MGAAVSEKIARAIAVHLGQSDAVVEHIGEWRLVDENDSSVVELATPDFYLRVWVVVSVIEPTGDPYEADTYGSGYSYAIFTGRGLSESDRPENMVGEFYDASRQWGGDVTVAMAGDIEDDLIELDDRYEAAVSEGEEGEESAGNPMYLRYLPVSQQWAILFGDKVDTASLIDLDGQRLFGSRKEATEALARKGLRVDKRGLVS